MMWKVALIVIRQSMYSIRVITAEFGGQTIQQTEPLLITSQIQKYFIDPGGGSRVTLQLCLPEWIRHK